MKAILEFELPEEQEEFQAAVQGVRAASVIHEMFQELRKVWKYSEDEVAVEAAEKWKAVLLELVHDHNVTLD